MIGTALTFFKDELNNYFLSQTGNGGVVSLTHLTDDTGKPAAFNIGLTLVNVEEERKLKSQTPYRETSDGKRFQANPEIKINLFLLISAGHPIYSEGLDALSHVIQYFQAQHVFTPQSHPALEQKIERLICDLYSLSFEQQNNLWGSLSTRYVPSVLYRVRLLAFEQTNLDDEVPGVSSMEPNLNQQ